MSKYTIIVDPLSTGQEYPAAFKEAGQIPVAVLSGLGAAAGVHDELASGRLRARALLHG